MMIVAIEMVFNTNYHPKCDEIGQLLLVARGRAEERPLRRCFWAGRLSGPVCGLMDQIVPKLRFICVLKYEARACPACSARCAKTALEIFSIEKIVNVSEKPQLPPFITQRQ